MGLPLFIDNICSTRAHCGACRGPSELWRAGWAMRFQMPATWPECPFGIPRNYTPPPPPPPPHLLGILLDAPESDEAKALQKLLDERVARVKPVCDGCAERIDYTIDGQVDCRRGYRCGCGGDPTEVTRGFVHLGTGMCKLNRWAGL